jgi:nicotinamidase/pyrazinamidase
MNGRLVFLDIDTQVDFMLPDGALYVAGAVDIIPKLRLLVEFARKQGIPVLSSADAHAPHDPGFAQWPPHCVIGTPGQRRIPETQLPSALVIPNSAGAFRPAARPFGQTIVEKADYDISSNPNFDAVLEWLDPGRFAAFGVATEYCVRSSVLSLRRRGYPVDLVVDAIRAIAETGGRSALDEMFAAGVGRVTTEEAIAGFGVRQPE